VSEPLAHVIEHVAHLLPAQGPITVFIHHNTLHAFEHLPFEEAVVEGGRLLGCQPFLSEERYRREWHRGRIGDDDVRTVLDEALGEVGEAEVGGLAPRRVLRETWLRHGVPEAAGHALEWLLGETEALDALRGDLTPDARRRILGPSPARGEERRATRALWEACLFVVGRASVPAPPPAPLPVRHRDLLLAATGADPDALVHPLLIRLAASYLDQGLASWAMPDRDRGFHRAVIGLYARGRRWPDPFLGEVGELLAEEAEAARTPLGSIERSLERLGVRCDDRERFLMETALALRGWAGMMRQVEERPDRVPVHAPPARLTDFLAIRLLLDRAAAAVVARETLDEPVELSRLREALAPRQGTKAAPALADRAWPLFHLAQLLGCRPGEVTALPLDRAVETLDEIAAFDSTTRRRLLHLAYERRLRRDTYAALVGPPPADPPPSPSFQAMFCIDEREESIRRHLEEVAPDCETFGAAGFFGVAMYYRAADEVHARPLCPVVLRPEHEVAEVATGPATGRSAWRGRLRHGVGRLGLDLAVGSRSLVRGTLATALVGALASLPLVFRVLFPRFAARMRHTGRRVLGGDALHRLAVERRDVTPSLGRWSGFTTAEMAGIVGGLLGDAGMAGRLAPLVVVVGHGSTSLNNPHESAHDCGACGGGRGGPNARAFAQMANDAAVRRLLAEAGRPLPAATWFVGAEHNTANDAIVWYDLDRVPQACRRLLREVRRAFDRARRRDAHERCRRFDAVPTWFPSPLALAHVETRAEDLAQPRPEYGHATNACCVVGRRARTRGLFLDRRAFLVSYDPTQDDAEGSALERLLGAVFPVVAGISLEYYFGYVDPTGYGCGTKLPHNVTALLGVMDGHASDLRTGLPWQMLEIHEPVRLSIVVEAPTDLLRRIVRRNEALDRLVSNRWIVLGALATDRAELHELCGERWVPSGVQMTVAQAPDSVGWYRGRRGPLPFARLGGVPEGVP
jgi:hypothetical protein